MENIKKDMEELAGSWNGEDDEFTYDGEVYTEEDAHMANDIVEKIKEIEELLKAIND